MLYMEMVLIVASTFSRPAVWHVFSQQKVWYVSIPWVFFLFGMVVGDPLKLTISRVTSWGKAESSKLSRKLGTSLGGRIKRQWGKFCCTTFGPLQSAEMVKVMRCWMVDGICSPSKRVLICKGETTLAGGFKHFLFFTLFGEDFQFD